MISELTFVLLIVGFLIMKIVVGRENTSFYLIKAVSIYLSVVLYIASYESFLALVSKSSLPGEAVMGGLMGIFSFAIATVLLIGLFFSKDRSISFLKRILR